MGRVCYDPYEGACNRAVLDSAVGINSVERFLADLAIKAHARLIPCDIPNSQSVYFSNTNGAKGLFVKKIAPRLPEEIANAPAAPMRPSQIPIPKTIPPDDDLAD